MVRTLTEVLQEHAGKFHAQARTKLRGEMQAEAADLVHPVLLKASGEALRGLSASVAVERLQRLISAFGIISTS